MGVVIGLHGFGPVWWRRSHGEARIIKSHRPLQEAVRAQKPVSSPAPRLATFESRLLRFGGGALPPSWTIVVVVLAIVLSSFNALPAIIFVLLFISYLISVVRRRRIRVARAVLLVFAFVATGIIHGVVLERAPTADCADGSYSYSTLHQGICSWRGGVVQLSPRLTIGGSGLSSSIECA